MGKYKTGDTLPMPDGFDHPSLQPTEQVKDLLQNIANEFAKYGYTPTKDELLVYLTKNNPLGDAFADLSTKVTEDYDETDFTAKPLARILDEIRESFQSVRRNTANNKVTLTDAQANCLSVVGSVVSIDHTAKAALYPLKLTAAEVAKVNEIYAVVDTINGLKNSAWGLKVIFEGSNFVKYPFYQDCWVVEDAEVYRAIASTHDYTPSAN